MQAVVAVVGGVVGFAVAGPAGARWGFTVGGIIGGWLYPPAGGASPASFAQVGVTSAQKGQVLPVVYGTMRITGSVMWYGNFNIEEGGSKKDPGGLTTYRASMAIALCEGQATGFHRMWVGEDEVPLVDFVYGFRQGTPAPPATQMSPYLEPGQPDVRYPYICYMYLQDWDLGIYSAVPNFSFEVSRLTWDINLRNPAMAALGLNGYAENADGDMNPVYCLADFMTDTRYGLGIPTTEILASSFQNAATWCQNEGLYCSPVLDTSQDGVAHIEHLLSYFDGLLVYSQGLFKLKARHNPAYEAVDYQPVDWTEWLEHPTFSRASSRQTPNQMVLEYRHRDSDYSKSIAQRQDDWDVGLRGPYREQIVLPGVTTEYVADELSAKMFWSRVVSPFMVEVKLGPQALYYEPGDILSVVGSGAYALDDVRLRIINIREEKDGTFVVTAMEER